MSTEKLILIQPLCKEYEVEVSFFSDLHAYGIIQLHSVKEDLFIHEEDVAHVEKVIRIKQDLNINLEGIDVILNLLDKIEGLRTELEGVRNRLRLYEDND
jgi:cold shock CspA family protein